MSSSRQRKPLPSEPSQKAEEAHKQEAPKCKKCVHCPAMIPFEGSVNCDSCRLRDVASRNMINAKRREEGKCVSCNKDVDIAVGFYCLVCREKGRVRANNHVKKPIMKGGKCTTCKLNPATKSLKICQSCFLNAVERAVKEEKEKDKGPAS